MTADRWLELAKIAAPVLVAFLVAWATARWQLVRSRDERRQTRIEGVYRLLSQRLVELREFARRASPKDSQGNVRLPPMPVPEDRRHVEAQLELFGSEPVRLAYRQVLEAESHLSNCTVAWTDALGMSQPFSAADTLFRKTSQVDYREAREGLLDKCESALALLRSELS